VTDHSSRRVPPSGVMSESDHEASRRKPWRSRSSYGMDAKKKNYPTLLKLKLYYNLFIRCFERMSLVPHLRYNLAGSSGD